MSYIYKILMNELYGRFGINPYSTITEICDAKRFDYLINKFQYSLAQQLNDKHFLVSYTDKPQAISSVVDITLFEYVLRPKYTTISAVQMSAAITAYARMHMYPYISRPDCLYTDTDSAVLANPLPDEDISSTELGKLKLECKVKTGIFLAPKSYALKIDDGTEILKQKGPAKDLVDFNWFTEQYSDIGKTKRLSTTLEPTLE